VNQCYHIETQTTSAEGYPPTCVLLFVKACRDQILRIIRFLAHCFQEIPHWHTVSRYS